MSDGAIISWLNGAPSTSFSLSDRGLHYGDGLFETMRFAVGRIHFLALHRQRLLHGLRALAIDVVAARLDNELAALCDEMQQRGIEQAVIKLIVTRGAGGRGYSPATAVRPATLLLVYPYVPRAEVALSGADVTLCNMQLGDQPRLAGIKHLNRLENVLARAEWSDQFHEGLMLGQQGEIVEGTMSNVFFVDGNVLVTPAITRCGVAGVMRRVVMERVAPQLGLQVRETSIAPGSIAQFDAGFLTNAVIGIWPIRQLFGRSLQILSVVRDIQRVVDACRETP
jgi:4-amino-4-deoxychorismate lyase